MTSPIPESELAAIAARAEKATPGPWEASHDEWAPNCSYASPPGVGDFFTGYEGEVKPDDAIFIAAARTDVPRLLAEVKRQAERVRILEEALTPSAETKAAYLGEFKFPDGDDGDGRDVTVPWTTIKEIMKAIAARAALEDGRL